MRLGTSYEHRARIAHALIDVPGEVILGRPVPVVPEEDAAPATKAVGTPEVTA
jgi:hypothetical protein